MSFLSLPSVLLGLLGDPSLGALQETESHTLAQERIHVESGPSIPVVLSASEGVLWVEKCIKLHPEIVWLADEHVRKTEEGQATLQGTYSEQLFGQKYIEFDRTIMTLHCLKCILDGSEEAYMAFTSAQPRELRLSRESFQILVSQGQRILKSNWHGMSELQMAQALETALVLGDIGKSEKARALFMPYGVRAPDHDDFYGDAMHVLERSPELCHSFSRLPTPLKMLLVSIANLAHYGHVTHLEGGLSMFSKLRESSIAFQDPLALSFDLFVHACDVAGALGHVNNQSSLVYTEPTHRAMQAMGEAVCVLSNPQKTERDAYNAYAGVRASWLGLCLEERSNRVLVRIGAMLRLFTPEEGIVLKRAFLELDGRTRENIIEQLDVEQPDQPNRTPTYMPAMLMNLFNNPQLGGSKENRLAKAITIGLPCIARVLERYKEMFARSEIDSHVPLNFNTMAGIAKASPASLNGEFCIDKEGVVRLESQSEKVL